MGLFPKKSPGSPLNRSESLSCVPVKSTEVLSTRLESGDVELSYPIALKPWIAKLARRFGRTEAQPNRKRLQLDALGTAVWDLVDGRRNVAAVVKVFGKKYQLHPKEAEVSVTRFLYELGKRGIVGFK